MDQLYFDGMAISAAVGFPDLFITFTVLYTIEFQKRGLPHAHILLFLHPSSKYPTHGYGGTGKTFMWRTLASSLRSRSKIVLTVASSGIASLLLPGGRTAHSKFKIPVPTLDNSTCSVEHNDELAGLLKQTKLIIWDEAPMAHRYTFEALERTLRDVMSSYSNSDNIFGGKVIVFGGDFRQILPVVPRGSRSDIVHASINSSKIWDHCKVLTLTQNMRLKSSGNQDETAKFSEWLLKVGEGKIEEPNDGYAEIEIPKEHLILDYAEPIPSTLKRSTDKIYQWVACKTPVLFSGALFSNFLAEKTPDFQTFWSDRLIQRHP